MPSKRKPSATRQGFGAAKPKPRVPLPRQTGGAHEDRTKRPWRERKHKGRLEDS